MNTPDQTAEAERLGAGFDMIRGRWCWVWGRLNSLDQGVDYATKREAAAGFLRSHAALEAHYRTRSAP